MRTVRTNTHTHIHTQIYICVGLLPKIYFLHEAEATGYARTDKSFFYQSSLNIIYRRTCHVTRNVFCRFYYTSSSIVSSSSRWRKAIYDLQTCCVSERSLSSLNLHLAGAGELTVSIYQNIPPDKISVFRKCLKDCLPVKLHGDGHSAKTLRRVYIHY